MKAFKQVISYFCAHPTASNLLMLLFIALGAVSVTDLKRETFPDFSINAVEISVAYPGATADDVESSVCRRIEDAIDSVSNIAEIKSTAMENRASVVVEMAQDNDIIEFFNDIKTEVEAVNDFPVEVEDVIVKRVNRTDPVVSVAVTGPMSPLHLKFYCEDLKDRLKRLDRVSQVEILGFSDHEFLIEIPFYNMMRLGLSVSDIQGAVAAQNVDLPAGSLETRDSDILIRFSEERKTLHDLENLIVVSSRSGAEIRLGEIAKIFDRFMDDEDKILFDGKRAGLLQINKTKSEDALKIMDEVAAFLEEEQARAPSGVSFSVTQNVSKIVRDRLQMLIKNAVVGLILVFLAMLLFFPFGFSFWVAMGLPVSFFLTFFFMKHLGLSINMVSMVGLLIGLGLLMDDAIVIAENISAHLDKGKTIFNSTVDGICEVAAGVFSSFLTTVFIFGSLALSMAGDIGKVLYVIPVVLILTLCVSLVEAFLILPHHLSHSLSKRVPGLQKKTYRQKMDDGVNWLKEKFLGRIVDAAVNFRYLFIGLVIFAFIASVAMIAGGRLKTQAFPDIEGDVLQARVLFPQGTPLERTQFYVDQLVAAAQKMNDRLAPSQPGKADLVEHIGVLYNTNVDAGEKGAHVATISLDLLSAEKRFSTMDDIIGLWRTLAGDIPDAIAVAFKEPVIGPGGLPIEIRLKGDSLDELKQASTQLINWFYAYEGVSDLYDDLRPGKPEIQVKLKKGAKIRGFDAQIVSKQLRAAFYGATASEVIVGDDSYEVNIRMAGADRNSVSSLENFYLMDGKGERVPLNTVASITYSRGYSGIKRVDADRTVTITGDVDTRVANAADIIADTKARFLPQLKKQFPNIIIGLEGQEKEMKASMGGMVKALGIGVFGVFCLLSFQFRSYQEPLVIMITIPFAFIGVVWGHILMGLDISMPSIMGFVSLAGIVVNDSILLVGFIKLHTALGKSVGEAGKLASRERFRAVMLTSVTTIAGLLPLLSERSLQAQILIPLACSIVFGLLMSTLLVLVVVPCLYTILADFNLVKPVSRTDFVQITAKD
ncbi:efflux RND transporter permease subunit [Desulfobacula phenolica]|uniref:Multidrug efflux pump subunit AcrB n=1 Tax=Desulfobacula phenolica TaxID=90732 RepID=A0A1H2DYF6_9BACT|nr:efflux RND transporter permease subunit [Desulfobacula phenolica]SDT87900.1 Multidrug efflux pump subunit AcrB [Desulfobacula phenolica]